MLGQPRPTLPAGVRHPRLARRYLAIEAHRETKQNNLALAGGVALNCVANGRLLREGPFENIWIQPAAGDAGGALGAALVAWHHYLNHTREVRRGRDSQHGSFLGPQFDPRQFLDEQKIPHLVFADDELFEQVARLLAAGKIIGWFQGRMEFGPRALGNRSILADSRSSEMQETLI